MLKPTEPKFFVDDKGAYLGSFSGIQKLTGKYEDGTEVILHPGEFPPIPMGAIEIPSGPEYASQIWDFVKKKWLPVSKK